MKFQVGEVYIDKIEIYYQIFKILTVNSSCIKIQPLKRSEILMIPISQFTPNSTMAKNSRLLTEEEKVEYL